MGLTSYFHNTKEQIYYLLAILFIILLCRAPRVPSKPKKKRGGNIFVIEVCLLFSLLEENQIPIKY